MTCATWRATARPIQGPSGLFVVVAVEPAGIGGDGQAPHRAPGDLQRAGGGAGGQRQYRPHPLRVHDRPLQHLHSPHRAADHRQPAADPEMVGQPAWTRTMSRMVTTGKRGPQRRPAAGSKSAGPVVPWQPPSTLLHTTK